MGNPYKSTQKPKAVKDELVKKRRGRPKQFKLPEVIEGAWVEEWHESKKTHAMAKRIVLTDTGLFNLAKLASKGLTKPTLAHCLGLPFTKFTGLLGRADDNDDDEMGPAGKAYRLGRSMIEDNLTASLVKMSKTQVVAAIYLSKSQMGWRDNDPAPQTEGERHVHIHLPESQSREEFFKSFQMAHELQNAALPAAMLQTSAASLTAVETPKPQWPPK